ncbi:hypothetical protein [Sporosarcina sp. FSL K6-3457]|uniref:hypothetical protein n=1 Tax=Sporosarcina sp. FSL K6-3457 TaxID=2978204 RepID=UPI0030F9DA54
MKTFMYLLRNDYEFLREIILFLFCLSLGTYKVFFQDTNKTMAIIFGLLLYAGAIVFIWIFIGKFKKSRVVK